MTNRIVTFIFKIISMRKLIILRGVPGSGKSTYAQFLKNKEELKGKRVKIINRDDIRMAHCRELIEDERYVVKMNERLNLDEMYQMSFKIKEIDKEVKQFYYQTVADLLFAKIYDVIILDTTFIDMVDIAKTRMLLDFCNGYEVDIYEMTSLFTSSHDVPDNIMNQYKVACEQTRIHARKLATNYYYVK